MLCFTRMISFSSWTDLRVPPYRVSICFCLLVTYTRTLFFFLLWNKVYWFIFNSSSLSTWIVTILTVFSLLFSYRQLGLQIQDILVKAVQNVCLCTQDVALCKKSLTLNKVVVSGITDACCYRQKETGNSLHCDKAQFTARKGSNWVVCVCICNANLHSATREGPGINLTWTVMPLGLHIYITHLPPITEDATVIHRTLDVEGELQESLNPYCKLGALIDALAHDFSLVCTTLNTALVCLSAYCIATV